jgi:biopolymer transport protein ExbD
MGMQIGNSSNSGEPEVMVEMNTTPLIDVMLVLLIMLILTIPPQTHAVKLNMSSSAAPPQVKPVVIHVDLDFDGTVYWNGEMLKTAEELDAHMRGVAAQENQPEVHVRPNKLVEYKHVAAVMSMAQRDGAKKIGIVDN